MTDTKDVIDDFPSPTVDEIEVLMMIGGPFTDAAYIAEQLPRLRANEVVDGVYGFGHYPMAKSKEEVK